MRLALVTELFQKRPFLISSILLTVYGLAQIFFGNITPVCNGYGQDGCLYGEIVEHFEQKFFVEKLNSYYVQRVLPFGLMHVVFRVFDMPLEPHYIVKAFQLYNLILFLVINYIWLLIVRLSNFRQQLFWLGWVFIFINQVVGKNAFYNPVMTDYTAYFLGFALLYFYLKNNLVGLVIVCFMGAFTWASFLYYAVFFILFPTKENNLLEEFWDQKKYNYLGIFLIPILYLLFVFSYVEGDVIYWSSGVYETVVRGNRYIFYLSAILNSIVLIFFLRYYLPPFYQIWEIASQSMMKLSVIRIAVILFLFLGCNLLIKYLSTTEEQFLNPYKIYGYILFNNVQSPLIFIVEAISSLGPVMIILILYFKSVVEKGISFLGLGVYLSFIIFFIFKLIPESRLIINYHPVIIFLSCYYLNNFFISYKFFWLFVAISLLFSRIYLSFLGIEVRIDDQTGAGFFEIIFIQKLGISHEMYLLLKTASMVVFLFFIFFLTTKLDNNFYLVKEEEE